MEPFAPVTQVPCGKEDDRPLGRQGRELAEREFSSRVQVDRYVDLYRSKL